MSLKHEAVGVWHCCAQIITINHIAINPSWRTGFEVRMFQTCFPIVSFHNDFLLAESSSNTANEIVSYNNPLPGVKQYFPNIAAIQNLAVLQQIWLYEIIAIQNLAVLQQIWLYEIIGDTSPMCQNTMVRVNGALIKRYCALCSETYNTLHSCHNFPAGSRQATGGARTCETSLLSSKFRYITGGVQLIVQNTC